MSAGYTISNSFTNFHRRLTSNEILNLFTTPVTLIAAPGANYTFGIIYVYARINFGGTAYSNTGFALYIQNNSNSPVTNSLTGFLNSTTTRTTNVSVGANVASEQYPANQPLIVQALTANPTTGNGTVDLWIAYNVFFMP